MTKIISFIFFIYVIAFIFLVPWAISLGELSDKGASSFAFMALVIFSLILVLGSIYFWKRGVKGEGKCEDQ